ncbi:MAG: response regulator, partial [Acidobacteriota bacterium]
RMLGRLGFRVLAAEGGAEALETYARNLGEIDLVILDLSMPRMDGEETLRGLRAIKEDVRVVLSSGYAEDMAVERFEGLGLAGFLQKPYRQTELILKLDEVLDLRSR